MAKSFSSERSKRGKIKADLTMATRYHLYAEEKRLAGDLITQATQSLERPLEFQKAYYEYFEEEGCTVYNKWSFCLHYWLQTN